MTNPEQKTSALLVRLFDGLAIEIDPPEPLKFAALRAEILVAWLALHPGQHRRERIATLLWDERDQTRVLSNLRTLLSRLPGPVKPFLRITPQTVGIDPEQTVAVDLVEFDRLLAASAHAEAEALLSGEVLASVHIAESEDLYAWMLGLRQAYAQKGIDLLQILTESALDRRAYGEGVLYARKLVSLDPEREASYRLLMRLLMHDGRRGEAARVFAACRQMLAEEFDIEPEPETTALAHRIQQGEHPRSKLPQPSTPFIGRSQELAHLRRLVMSGDIRLISLVGAGGMGKTRLAIECGRLLEPHFLDGAAFVSLAAIDRPERVAVAIGDGLAQLGAIPVNAADLSPLEHLCRHLADREMLLILDNVDHVVASAPRLGALLDRCPGLTLLVTSRTRLGLHQEQRVEVTGMQYSSAVDAETWPESDAVRLFVQTARRIVPEWTMSADERRALAEICSAVGGMPLALELAAQWVRIHSCGEILAAIRQNIEFLTGIEKDAPERQRSILAVFSYSWEQLSATEQAGLARMAVFGGPFDFPAARQIAGASRAVLAGLLDHSLLVRSDTARGRARFALHPLLREYALRRLAQAPKTLADVQRRHIRYYLEPLAATAEPDGDGVSVNGEIRDDLDNVRAAWDGAIRHEMWPLLVDACRALSAFWRHAGLNQEGAESLGRAVDGASGRAPDALVLGLRLERIRFLRNLARYPDACAEIEAAVEPGDGGAESRAAMARIYLLWGEILAFRSQLDQARETVTTGLDIATRLEDGQLIGEGHRLLGLVAYYRGEMENAMEHFRTSYAVFQEDGEPRGVARTQNNLGMVYHARGKMGEALGWFKEAVATWEEAGDRQSALRGKTNLGTMLMTAGHFREALVHLDEVQARFREMGASRGEGTALLSKGRAYTTLGQYELAEKCLKRGLVLFQRAGATTEQAACRNGLARLYLAQGRPGAARMEAEAARRLADDAGNQTILAGAYSYLGYIALDVGEMAGARKAFEEALAIQERMQSRDWMHESRAGLAAAALLAGEPDVAEALLLPHATHLTPGALQVALQPIDVVLTYVRALQTSAPETADRILAMGREMLAAWAREAPDAASRESLQNAVPAHRALLALGQPEERAG